MKHLFTFENYTINEQSTPATDTTWLKQFLQALAAEKKKLRDLQEESLKHMSKQQYKNFISQKVKIYKEGKLVSENESLYDYCVSLIAMHQVVDKVEFTKSQDGTITNISIFEVEV